MQVTYFFSLLLITSAKQQKSQGTKYKQVPKYLPKATYCEACHRVADYLYENKMRLQENFNPHRSMLAVCNHVELFKGDPIKGFQDNHLWESCKLHTENWKLPIIREMKDHSDNLPELKKWYCFDVTKSCVGVNNVTDGVSRGILGAAVGHDEF